MNLKIMSVFIIGFLLGSGLTYQAQEHEDNREFFVGDRVQTTEEWNSFYEPIQGNVTEIEAYHGNYFIGVDGGRQINEYWFEEKE